jgi:hypothetical protein
MKRRRRVYIIGSLRNENVVRLEIELRKLDYAVFAQWYGAGPTADDCWKKYEQDKGRTYGQALYSGAATHVFQLDATYLKKADIAVLLLPAGKSGHLECGVAIGAKKRAFIVFEEEPTDRWDLMLRFAEKVFFSQQEFLDFMRAGAPRPRKRRFVYDQ